MINTTAVSKARRAAAVGAVLFTAAASVGLTAAPAEAATERAGCTVTPYVPEHLRHNTAGEKVIRYRVKVACDADRTVVIRWQGVEEDWSTWWNKDPDDGHFSITRSRTFGSEGTRTLVYDKQLPDTESGSEEMYQKVRFVVTSNGVESESTSWERTPYRSFRNG